MIDKEKIQQAANEYVGHEPEIGEDLIEYAIRDAFKNGIEWFKKTLWHSEDEIPQAGQRILIVSLDNSGSSIISTSNDLDLGDFDKKQQWETFCEYVDTDFKWCYIEDLLQNK